MQDIGGGVPVLALVAAVGALASVILCIILPRKTPPEGAMRLSLVCFAFLTSIVWILVIANELVGIAATFGIVSGMSDSMVGLTILSIGNSVNDMAADVTIARAGFPSMAIAGAYAGPMFSTSRGQCELVRCRVRACANAGANYYVPPPHPMPSRHLVWARCPAAD